MKWDFTIGQDDYLIVLGDFGFEGMLRYEKKNKSTFHLPRQEVAFLEKCRKIKGFWSLRRDFYTGFIQIFKDLGL